MMAKQMSRKHSGGVGFSLIAGNPDRVVEVQDVEERTGHKCLEDCHCLNVDAWQCADTEPVASDGAQCDDAGGQPLACRRSPPSIPSIKPIGSRCSSTPISRARRMVSK